MNLEQNEMGYVRNKNLFLILPRFQFKIIGLVFFSSIGTMALAGGAYYYLVNQPLQRLLDRANLAEGVRTEMLHNLSWSFSYLVLLCGALALLMLWFAVRFSHRVAGPIYQINKVLDQFFEGDREARIYLRKGDEFIYLGDKLNRVLREASRASKEAKVDKISS